MTVRRRSSAPVGGALAVLVGLAGAPRPAPVVAQEGGPDLAAAAARFERECASCHVTPDPGVATDRAWIRQLQETA